MSGLLRKTYIFDNKTPEGMSNKDNWIVSLYMVNSAISPENLRGYSRVHLCPSAFRDGRPGPGQ
jgi:hypothetical protein